MRVISILALASLALALPHNHHQAARELASLPLAAKRQSIVEQLQETFDRDNPNGTPTSAGDPDDLNGDGVINVFEANAATGK